jgi:hypothetical protein
MSTLRAHAFTWHRLFSAIGREDVVDDPPLCHQC